MGLKISVTIVDAANDPLVIFENLKDYKNLSSIIEELAHEWEIVMIEEIH